MKTMRSKLSSLLAVVLILGTIAASPVFAKTVGGSGETTNKDTVSQKNYEEEVEDFIEVTGGATKANATSLLFKPNGPDYCCEIKSTKKLTYFKFKTRNYYAYYGIDVEFQSYSPGSIEYFFRRANDTVIQKGLKSSKDGGVYYSSNSFIGNLQPNSWYYLVIKNTKKARGNFYIYNYVIKDEDRDTKNTAKIINAAKTYNGTMGHKKDVDYYKFVPKKTGKYTVIVRAAGTFPDYMRSLAASFLRSDGSTVVKKSLFKKGEAMISTRKLTKGKTYYIKVSNSCRNFWNTGEVYKYKVRIQNK